MVVRELKNGVKVNIRISYNASETKFYVRMDLVENPDLEISHANYIDCDWLPFNNILYSCDTWTHKNFRRLGAATLINDYVKSIGKNIVADRCLTKAGKKFYKSLNLS